MNKKEIVPATRPWKYEESVEVAKSLVGTAFKCTLDLVRELYAAREALHNERFRSDVAGGKMYRSIVTTGDNFAGSGSDAEKQFHTFQDYLTDIGLSPRTARYWLSLYSPREDKLYSPEELKQKVLALFQEVRERRKDEYAWEPDGWTPALEAKYRKWESQQKLADKVADDVAGQGDAITREWLLQEQGRIESSAMTAEEIVHVTDLMQEYQPHMPAGVEAKGPCHLVYLVEEAARKAVPDDPVKFIGAVSGILNDIIREAGK